MQKRLGLVLAATPFQTQSQDPIWSETQAWSGCIQNRLCDSPPKARCPPLAREDSPYKCFQCHWHPDRGNQRLTCVP